MALKGKAEAPGGGGGEYELLDADTYEGRLVAIVDVGTHETKYGPKHQVVFVWELTNGPARRDGKPWFVYDRYTLSFNDEAALRLTLEAWRRRRYEPGEEIDPAKYLGQPWSVEVVHKPDGKGVTRWRVGKVGPVAKSRAAEVRAPSVLPFVYEQGGDGGDLARAADWLPYVYGQKIADLVALGRQGAGAAPAAARPAAGGNGAQAQRRPAPAGVEEDIPF